MVEDDRPSWTKPQEETKQPAFSRQLEERIVLSETGSEVLQRQSVQKKMLDQSWALCCSGQFHVVRMRLLTAFAILKDIFKGYSYRDVDP